MECRTFTTFRTLILKHGFGNTKLTSNHPSRTQVEVNIPYTKLTLAPSHVNHQTANITHHNPLVLLLSRATLRWGYNRIPNKNDKIFRVEETNRTVRVVAGRSIRTLASVYAIRQQWDEYYLHFKYLTIRLRYRKRSIRADISLFNPKLKPPFSDKTYQTWQPPPPHQLH